MGVILKKINPGGSMNNSFENIKLTAVEDYCFLSSPEAVETFIVEFSGRVRLYYENDTPVLSF